MTAEKPSDWSTSYSRFLAQSAALSARTLQLYQQALQEVSRGKLPPTVFQDHLPRFAQAHAAELTLQLAETGAQFMTNLMRVGARFGERASAGGDEPELNPPYFDPRNPVRWYEQLGDYAGQLNARAVRRYRAQLDRVASGETTASEVQQSASDLLARSVPEYLQELTGIYFDLLDGLNQVRSRYEEAYFRELLGQVASEEGEGPVLLRLFGVLGTTVSGSLSVVNTTPQQASITYRIAALRRADGVGPAFAANIAILPEKLDLAAGAEATVTVAVPLDAQKFEPNVPYLGAFHILGGPDLQVAVQLHITATASSPNGADTTPQP